MIRWKFVDLAEAGSTQTVAKKLALEGEAEGTTVVAVTQSAAHGRLGRPWVSPPGGLYMSFILRPGRISRPQAIPMTSAVAVVQGINATPGLPARLRWPNDVMLGSKKVGGIIAEAQIHKDEVIQAVVGVGVNVNTLVSMMGDVGAEATSLRDELGRSVDVSKVKLSILDSFSRLYDRLKAGEDLTPLWTKTVGTLGKQVSIKMKTGETPFSYDAIGVAPEGGLVVTRGGAKAVIQAEDIEWLREGS